MDALSSTKLIAHRGQIRTHSSQPVHNSVTTGNRVDVCFSAAFGNTNPRYATSSGDDNGYEISAGHKPRNRAARNTGMRTGSSPSIRHTDTSIATGSTEAITTPSDTGVPAVPGPSPSIPTTPSRIERWGGTTDSTSSNMSANAALRMFKE